MENFLGKLAEQYLPIEKCGQNMLAFVFKKGNVVRV